MTNYGVFTMGTYRSDTVPGWCNSGLPPPNGCSEFYELYLNGHRIASQAQRFMTAFGGRPFYSEEDQNVWLWGNWVIRANSGQYPNPNPTALVDDPVPPTFQPPYTPSADGSSITAPTGTLTTSEGIWTWGGAGSSGYRVALNGTYIWPDGTQGIGIAMQVNSNGHMFIQQPDSSWRVYLDYATRTATAPTGQAIPLRVDMTPTASPITVPCGDLIFRSPNAGPAGAIVGFLTVPMSNGSAFAGTVTVNPNSGITLFDAAIDGTGKVTLTTKQSPLYPPDNFAGVSIAVSQNGTSVGSFHIWLNSSGC